MILSSKDNNILSSFGIEPIPFFRWSIYAQKKRMKAKH